MVLEFQQSLGIYLFLKLLAPQTLNNLSPSPRHLNNPSLSPDDTSFRCGAYQLVSALQAKNDDGTTSDVILIKINKRQQRAK
jgi:hypothetical protein